jgi:erythritol transport system permease protein
MQKQRGFTMTDFQQLLLRGRAFIALILVTVVFSYYIPNFLGPANIEIMAKHVALNAILGVGMTFVILTGGIDLSVGSLVGLTAMIAGLLINEGLRLPMFGVIAYPHTWLICAIALVVGTLMGAITGFIITRFNVAPFIATLGMLTLLAALPCCSTMATPFPILSADLSWAIPVFRRSAPANFSRSTTRFGSC